MNMADIKIELKKLIVWQLLISFYSIFFVSEAIFAGEFIWGNNGHPFTYSKKDALQINIAGKGNENIQIEKRSFEFNNDDWFETIHLSFDEENKPSYLKQRFKDAHTIVKSNFKKRSYPGSVYSAASFENANHQIWLIPSDNSFLNHTKHVGNFSILFLIKPHTANLNMPIFYKTGFFEGKKHGIACDLRGKRLVFQFYNLFWLAESSLPLVQIKTKEQLSTTKFHKVLLEYKESEAKLSLFLDSSPQKVLYVTEGGQPNHSRYIARFHPWDKSPLIIGKKFTGALDEIIFSNHLILAKNDIFSYGATQKIGSRFRQKSGSLLSKVYSMPYSRSQISSLSYTLNKPQGSSIRLYIRFSDRPFSTDLHEAHLPYKEIKIKNTQELKSFNTQINKSVTGTFSNRLTFTRFRAENIGKGKYFQWKAIFYPDPLGEHTPILDEVRLRYYENPPPSPPKKLEVVSINNDQITLRFSRNSELDVLQGGRYHIYYGIKPDIALGVIRYQKINNSKKITISDKDHLLTKDLRYQNRIQITLNNQMIYENLIYTQKKPYLNYEYPFLQKDISYYFWVTSCDNSYAESMEYADHESQPSNHVIARIH